MNVCCVTNGAWEMEPLCRFMGENIEFMDGGKAGVCQMGCPTPICANLKKQEEAAPSPTMADAWGKHILTSMLARAWRLDVLMTCQNPPSQTKSGGRNSSQKGQSETVANPELGALFRPGSSRNRILATWLWVVPA